MKKRTGNDVRLRDVPEKILREARNFAVAEVEACDDDGICPEQRSAFVAVANCIADELRRRGKKIGCKLPPVPTAPEAKR